MAKVKKCKVCGDKFVLADNDSDLVSCPAHSFGEVEPETLPTMNEKEARERKTFLDWAEQHEDFGLSYKQIAELGKSSAHYGWIDPNKIMERLDSLKTNSKL